ncbi:MAG: phage holin family protein [Flaviflexus sp.]|nr:phage holin family protein [Flaviflexus sp.]
MGSIINVLVRTLLNAAGLWVAVQLLPGMSGPRELSDQSTLIVYLGSGLILAVITWLARPVKIISIPFYILTLGLFSLIINAVILLISNWFATHLGWGLVVDSFGWAIIGAFIVATVVGIGSALLSPVIKR